MDRQINFKIGNLHTVQTKNRKLNCENQGLYSYALEPLEDVNKSELQSVGGIKLKDRADVSATYESILRARNDDTATYEDIMTVSTDATTENMRGRADSISTRTYLSIKTDSDFTNFKPDIPCVSCNRSPEGQKPNTRRCRCIFISAVSILVVMAAVGVVVYFFGIHPDKSTCYSPTVENGNSTMEDNTLILHCFTCYKPVNTRVECEKGNWNAAIGCSVVDCGCPSFLSDSESCLLSNTTCGSVATLSCDTPYCYPHYKCLPDGNWISTPTDESCRPHPCGDFDLPKYALLKNEFACINMTIELQCEEGFHFKTESDRFLRCVNETWIQDAECEIPGDISFTPKVPVFDIGSANSLRISVENSPLWQIIQVTRVESNDTKPTVVVTIFNTSGVVYTQDQTDSDGLKVNAFPVRDGMFIELQLQDLNCEDSVMYVCSIIVGNLDKPKAVKSVNTKIKVTELSQSLPVLTAPTQASIGSTITFACNGSFGLNQNDEKQGKLYLQIKYQNEDVFRNLTITTSQSVKECRVHEYMEAEVYVTNVMDNATLRCMKITAFDERPLYSDSQIFKVYTGLEIRLWPVNEKGNEGFVEVFYNESWGFVGNPEDRFDDVTASFLCQKLGLSQFGYSSGWTSIDNYMGYIWLAGLVCSGNETDINQCFKPYDWNRYNYGRTTGYAFRHGTRLYCTDSRLTEGKYQNSGRVKAVILDKVCAICHDAFDMNAASVFCSSLGYDGATEVYKGDPGHTTMFPGTLTCKGCEDTLSNCTLSMTDTSNCTKAAHVTCKAIRLARMSRYIDEGLVEIYYNRSWGMIGDPDFYFDNTTARYLCKSFGFGDVGFSTAAHSLSAYGRKGWLSSMSCAGSETDVMHCRNSGFYTVPSPNINYRRGTWLYCFDFHVDDVRLVGGSYKAEGTVQLLINGRWGYICTYTMNMYLDRMKNAGKVLCKQMGYSSFKTVLSDNSLRHSEDLVWMSEVACDGYETSIHACSFTKGPIPPCFDSPTYLRIRCTDQDSSEANTIVGREIRLWPVNEKGNEGFVEVFYNGRWGFIGSPPSRFDDVTASFLCQNLGLSQFGYSSGWTSIDNYMGYSWLSGLVCLGNETDIDQCEIPYWKLVDYGNQTHWSYRHGTRLYCKR